MNVPSRTAAAAHALRPLPEPHPQPAGDTDHLVALDIDGTLLDQRQRLATEVGQVVRRLASRLHIVLATGRSTVSTKQVAERLGLTDGYAVCSNGAVIARLGTFEPVSIATFDPGPAVRLLLRHLPDAVVAAEELGVGYRVSAPFPPGDLTGLQSVEPIDELIAKPTPRVVVTRPGWSAESLAEVVARAGLHGVSYAVGSTAWLDVTPAGVTKAAGLEQVRRWLGTPQDRTTAIGDGRNDADMLSWAHHGLAMAEAPDEVRAVADAVIGSVDDAAVAKELARRFH